MVDILAIASVDYPDCSDLQFKNWRPGNAGFFEVRYRVGEARVAVDLSHNLFEYAERRAVTVTPSGPRVHGVLVELACVTHNVDAMSDVARALSKWPIPFEPMGNPGDAWLADQGSGALRVRQVGWNWVAALGERTGEPTSFDGAIARAIWVQRLLAGTVRTSRYRRPRPV